MPPKFPKIPEPPELQEPGAQLTKLMQEADKTVEMLQKHDPLSLAHKVLGDATEKISQLDAIVRRPVRPRRKP